MNRTKTRKLAAFAAAAIALTMTGCSDSIAVDSSSPTSSAAESVSAVTAATEEIDADDIDAGYEESEAVEVTFSDNGAAAEGSGVTIDGAVVTITAEGTYLLSGSCSEGRVIVDAGKKDKVKLVLNGLELTCGSNAPLLVRSADKVYLTLEEGSVNSLADGGSYQLAEGENTDGVIFSKADLTINGDGELKIGGNYKHGIVSKDDLVITGGSLTVTAASSALVGKDSVKIGGGSFDLTSGKDAVKSTNTEDEGRGIVSITGGSFTINAGGDGIFAAADLEISGGELDITTGGGSANAPVKSDDLFGGRQGDFAMGGKWGEMGGFDRADMGDLPDDMGGFGHGVRGEIPPIAPEGEFSPLSAGGSLEIGFAVSGSDNTELMQTSAESGSSSAKGLKADGNIVIEEGVINIDSADDSLHCGGSAHISGGSITAASGDDGIHADGDLVIDGGSIDITKSYEGIEGMTVTISGGDISVVASDDGINCAGGSDTGSADRMGRDMFAAQEGVFLRISGGTVNVDSGGDGLDSNGDMFIEGGVIYVSGPENGGNGSIDFNGSASVTGGTIVALGAVGMEEMFGEEGSTQCAVLHDFSQSFSPGTGFTVSDSAGNVILSFVNEKTWQGAIFSSPELKQGESYTVSAGDESETIVLDGVTTSNSMGMGFGGGMHGGMHGRDF